MITVHVHIKDPFIKKIIYRSVQFVVLCYKRHLLIEIHIYPWILTSDWQGLPGPWLITHVQSVQLAKLIFPLYTGVQRCEFWNTNYIRYHMVSMVLSVNMHHQVDKKLFISENSVIFYLKTKQNKTKHLPIMHLQNIRASGSKWTCKHQHPTHCLCRMLQIKIQFLIFTQNISHEQYY